MTRPTPATLVECPSAHNYDSTIPDIDITHPSRRPHTTATDFTYTFVIPAIKSSLLLYLLPCLCSFHCLWLSLLARNKLKSIAGSTRFSAPQHSHSMDIWKTYQSILCLLKFDKSAVRSWKHGWTMDGCFPILKRNPVPQRAWFH